MAINEPDRNSAPQAQPERQTTPGIEAQAFQSDIAARKQSVARERGIRVASAETATADGALRLALPRMTVGTAAKFGLRATLGTASAPLAAAQTLLVPSNSSHLREGTLPGHPDIGYSYKISENGIEFFRQGADGTRNVLWSGSREGIKVDARGVPQINVNALTAIAPDGSWNRQWEKFPADQKPRVEPETLPAQEAKPTTPGTPIPAQTKPEPLTTPIQEPQKPVAVGGGYQAQPLPADTSVLENRQSNVGKKDGGKTGRKQPKNVDEIKERLEVEQQTLREMKSRPNKTPEDKKAIDRQQRLINSIRDKIKASEPHAIKGQ